MDTLSAKQAKLEEKLADADIYAKTASDPQNPLEKRPRPHGKIRKITFHKSAPR